MTERRVITFPADKESLSTLCFAYEACLVASRHFYRYRLLVRRRTLPQPGVSSTLRRTRRLVVSCCESNLGYLKPSFGVDTKGLLTCGNFVVSLSCFLVKKGSFILFFFSPFEENTKCKNIDTSYRSWITVILLSSLRSTKDVFTTLIVYK